MKNWTNDFSQAFKNPRELYAYLNWELPENLDEVAHKYPLFIPRALAHKIKVQGPDGVLAKEFLPHASELNGAGLLDPIGDRTYYSSSQLIHRYPSRVLFTATSVCPVHCRYCFRKNELSANDELFQQDFQETLSYLKDHPEVSEIIFTGGDPFTLSNEKLKFYLSEFAEIITIKDIRFHSRYPVIMPSRIDDELAQLLKHFSTHFRTISVAIHANHVDELDAEAEEAISKLARLPIQLLSQTVLLKDVNDSTEALSELIETFIRLKVRPYYLHHPDQVKGGMHFYLPLEIGRKIYASLRKIMPGWALPQYVIDVPGGFGKVGAYNPESLNFSGQLLSQDLEQLVIQEPEVLH